MRIDNPFMFITPRNKDLLVGRNEFLNKIKKEVLDSLKKQVIITINGDFGIGKTLFVNKVMNELEKKRNIKIFDFDFSANTLNALRKLPTEKELGKEIIVVIDRFELILKLTKEYQEKILKIMTELTKSEITIIVTSSNSLLKSIKKLDKSMNDLFKTFEVPAMNFEETKKLIISRLNEVRPKKSNLLEPFTNEEIKKIHNKSKGNPRMVLMLCASLFNEKF